MGRLKYKQLYIQEKIRREFYEKAKPELKKLWDDKVSLQNEVARDFEKTFIFGDATIIQTKFTGLANRL